MRWLEQTRGDIEFPGRYILDEARFPGGREHIPNKEENAHEPPSHHAR